MNQEQIELAHKASRLLGFEWREGMQYQDIHPSAVSNNPLRLVDPETAVFLGADGELNSPSVLNEYCTPVSEEYIVPWLADPTGATDGALLKLLGPKVAVYYSYTNLEWAVAIPYGGVVARAPTLAEACCRAALALGRWPGGVA
jgi:hypothetical protein